MVVFPNWLYQIGIDPKTGCEGESFDLAFCSQSIANSQVAVDVLFSSKSGQIHATYKGRRQTKSERSAASHTPVRLRRLVLVETVRIKRSTAPAYNRLMARGWESKSVEAQMESQAAETGKRRAKLTQKELERERRKADLLLSRSRILQQLDESSNERYSELLRRTLAELDAQIAKLAP